MGFRASVADISKIVNMRHKSPHLVLGMHIAGGRLVVRVFVADACGVAVVCNAKKMRWQMEKVHDDGFFELKIPRRKNPFAYQLEMDFGDGNIYTAHDPYSFAPVLTDYDLYLFANGTHYNLADKLGANPAIINGVEGVLFAVWAPNAMACSVIGNFNGYDGRRHPMRLLGNSGVWELFIPALARCDTYKFEVKVADGTLMQKADPFAKFAQPAPSTNSLVYDVGGFVWNDEDWLAGRCKGGALNIYEVNLASWRKSENGSFLTYCQLAHQLVDYAIYMGYTHLELMPIAEFPYDPSWGYQVTGYYAATSRFGNPHDFKYFINHCHKNGIGVILDWVPAHFPKDAHGLANFDGTSLYEHPDPKQANHPDWGTLTFDYGRKEVSNFLVANALFWLEEYHIDGLRVDAVASMLYLNYSRKDGEWTPNINGGHENLEAVEFIKHLNSIISQKFPDVMMIAEESTSYPNVTGPAEQGGLGFTHKWNMGWMNDFLSYMTLDPIHRKFHHNLLTFAMMYNHSENFVLVLSHDEVVHGKRSLLNKMPGDLWQKCANLRLALGFMYGHPGGKLLFMGGEFGQFIEWDENRELDWFLLDFDHHKQIQNFVRDLNHLYKAEPALWGNNFRWVDADNADHSITSFIRRPDDAEIDDELIIICNFTPVPHENHQIPATCSYIEALNSDHHKYGGSGVINPKPLMPENGTITLRLPPLGVTILRKIHEKP
ncbi:MAG: 1,4-alpha-glucan branching protein GlgB [Defluviitaleaceae bacterium]|nr:1,4-alpha-glucan branching protein GlgB [Defluviitaleaceae bacterium]